VRVCVVGSGGREHALAHVLGRTAEVVVTPGSPGIPGSAATPPGEVDADLYVIGPEVPLVDGTIPHQVKGRFRLPRRSVDPPRENRHMAPLERLAQPLTNLALHR
jgi:hypothetical protein